MSISQKLSWEIATLNDRGNTGDTERLAAEIAYGVSLTQGDPGSFVSTMNAIIEQVTNRMLRLHLALYVARGVAK